MNISRGRPRGGSDARDRILSAARARFAEHGYRGTTMRAVAADADVDVALISYHFGSKHGLFAAAMALATGPSDILLVALEGDRATLPERILTTVLNTWDQPQLIGPLRSLVAAALEDAEVMRAFREYVEREVVGRIAEHLGGPAATERATAVVSVVVGLVFSRHILRFRPAADLDPAVLHAALTPALRMAAFPPRKPGLASPAPGTSSASRPHPGPPHRT